MNDRQIEDVHALCFDNALAFASTVRLDRFYARAMNRQISHRSNCERTKILDTAALFILRKKYMKGGEVGDTSSPSGPTTSENRARCHSSVTCEKERKKEYIDQKKTFIEREREVFLQKRTCFFSFRTFSAAVEKIAPGKKETLGAAWR